jgi:lysyl-tRNA synthetase class 1
LCGHKASFDLRKKGIAKLPWRVDWPMRWHHEQVDFEPGGKDHSSAGGSFDTGKVISKKIWNYDAPAYIMYDFINFKGQGGKMSSSAGNTVTLRDVLKIYTPELVRFLFAGTRPGAEFSVSFDVDVFKVYEDFDSVERKYFHEAEELSEKDRENARRIYELSMIAVPEAQPIQPSFRHLATYVQLAEGDVDKVAEMLRGEIKSEHDEARVRRRAQCAWHWVREYAPEQYRFTLAKDAPYPVTLEEPVREALRALGALLAHQDEQTLLETFYQLCERHGIQNTEFFRGAYLALVGKEKGPKLANIITQAGHERIAHILKQL